MRLPTPTPERGGRRKQERALRLSEPVLIAVIAVTVIGLGVITAVLSNPTEPTVDLSATVKPTQTFTPAAAPAPQSVISSVKLKLAKKPPAEKNVQQLRANVEHLAPAAPAAPAVVGVGSFNILGSQHTGPGGDKGTSWPSAAARLPGAVERIKAHGVSVVGIQEAQPDQLAGLVNGTGFAIYPTPDANPLDRVNSILYDPQVFEFVSASTFLISNGNGLRPQPILRLRHIATGREAYFINAHPPAGHDGATVAKRAASMQRIVQVVNELKPQGIPIILTGDMNDREAFVQRVVNPAGLVMARPSGPISVDWVVGTPDVTFSDYIRDTTTASRRISDHFFISATATFGGTS